MKAICLFLICALMFGCAATQKSVKNNKTSSPIIIKAMDKRVKTNLLKANYGWGKKVPVLATSPKSKKVSKWFVEFPVVIDEPGSYQLEVSLAAKKVAPFDLVINNNKIISDISFQNGQLAGSATSNLVVGVVQLVKGKNVIEIKNDKSGSAPHITQFSITKISE